MNNFENMTCKMCGSKYHSCRECEHWITEPWKEDCYCSKQCALNDQKTYEIIYKEDE